MNFNHLIHQAAARPRQLFLLDGLGALLSALLLGVVLPRLQSLVGIPLHTLYLLATFPVFFAVFDCYSYRKKEGTLALPLKIIAILNGLYCGLSLGLALYHQTQLTKLGWLYIVVEVLIVGGLAIFEWRVAERIEDGEKEQKDKLAL